MATTPYTGFRDSLVDYVYRQGTITTWVNEPLKLRASAGESEREFSLRCQEEARRQRDKEFEATRLKLDKDLLRLQTQLEREEREIEQDKAEWEGRKRDELLSAGESLLGMFMGRKRTSALSKASRQRRMTSQSRADVTESEQSIAKLKEQIAGHAAYTGGRSQGGTRKVGRGSRGDQESAQRPRKSDIRVDAFGLTWVPAWYLTYRDTRGSVRDATFPAYTLNLKQ